MHLGNARTALLAWLRVRSAGGTMVLRIEDLDRARVVAGAEASIAGDLRWLWLDWDEGPDVGGPFGPYRQSERTAHYAAALERLAADGRAYACACSRAEVALAASAPQGDDPEGPRYPGTCRDLPPGMAEARARAAGRGAAIRFRAGEAGVRGGPEGARTGGPIGFQDEVAGEIGPRPIDDFVLRRGDGVAAYQLAVVVDDGAMGITHVWRGDDLLPSTPRQIALHRALGREPPAFGHVPLVLSPAGGRLAKRNRPASLADLRAAGYDGARVVGALAASAGLCDAGSIVTPRELLVGFDPADIGHEPVVVAFDGDSRPGG